MDDANQAEEDAAQEAPITSRQALQILGSPEPCQFLAGQQNLGLLNGLRGAAPGQPLGRPVTEDVDHRAGPTFPRLPTGETFCVSE